MALLLSGIDSLAQSWAVIAGGPNERSRQAFRSAITRLVKADSSSILLFEPPFDQTALDPGYVKGYVPGVREDGGQYTHAAMWLIQAATILNDGDLAMKLFNQLNPLHHSDSLEKAERYRVTVEEMLGIRIQHTQLSISPKLPEDWTEFQFTYRRNGTTWHLRALQNTAEISNPSSVQLDEDRHEHHLVPGFSTHRDAG